VSEFSTRFPIRRLPAFEAALGNVALTRHDRVQSLRRQNAEYFVRTLTGLDGIEIPQPAVGSEPAFLRLPILLKGSAERSRSYEVLRRLGTSTMYPHPVPAIPEARPHLTLRQPCMQAEDVARRILTLPTHPLVTVNDRERIVRHFVDGGRA
jgi:perosamine synthetase